MSKIYEALTKANQTPAVSAARETIPTPAIETGELPSRSDRLLPSRTEDVVPDLSEVDKPYLLLSSSDGRPNKVSDEFQVLAIRVQGLLKENGKRVVLVSSAVPDEGKSFVTGNLGIALAKLGRRVILVDADLRTPSLHRGFKTSPLNGLMPYLLGKVGFSECVYPTAVPGLLLIPAGGTSNSGPELFSGSQMVDFLTTATRSDPEPLVLIDSAPILAASETRIIASLVDAVLFVVAANRTSRTSVSRGLSYIKSAPLLGMVLNRFEPSLSGRSEYGYGYSAEYKDQAMF
jgi:capsular exopolysaccharide synthesis family protein